MKATQNYRRGRDDVARARRDGPTKKACPIERRVHPVVVVLLCVPRVLLGVAFLFSPFLSLSSCTVPDALLFSPPSPPDKRDWGWVSRKERLHEEACCMVFCTLTASGMQIAAHWYSVSLRYLCVVFDVRLNTSSSQQHAHIRKSRCLVH
ncbi:hypothetical protein EDB92DRAFT_1853797 [Lactarius akahatsu]|uniref:Transmembrane protein n=1 Tax=Lactarius akahatsu TaxID=416441 RepID=A0AAD4LN90_9AGAM|nr:hypothetical protein EDB92DRAFT_1853797 [Lactarius akahatsu]